MLRKVRQAQEDEIRGGCHRKNMRLIHSFVGDRNRSNMHAKQAKLIGTTLQMFTGNYRDSTGKSECRDFKFMGIACIPAIPVILKFHTLISIVIFAGHFILQGYYGDSPH